MNMKSKYEILDELFRGKEVHDTISNVVKSGSDKDDLTGELFLILCEMDEKKIQKAYKNSYLMYLVVNVLLKQYISTTSPFHKTYRKTRNLELKPELIVFADESTEGIDDKKLIEEQLSTVMGILDRVSETKCSKLDVTIFKCYYKLGEYNIIDGVKRLVDCNKDTLTTRKVSELIKTGVNHKGNDIMVTPVYVSRSLKRTINYIKSKVQKDIKWLS